MFKKIKKKNVSGFSMPEILSVVLIIGVIAAIALPSYRFIVEKSRALQGIKTLRQIAKAQNIYNSRIGRYSSTLSSLPLELKDKNNNMILSSQFEDDFFEYAVYGNTEKISTAGRKNGNYELSISYETGEWFCSPSDNRICKMLSLGERDENQLSDPDQPTEPLLPYEPGQGESAAEEENVVLICYPSQGICRTYKNGQIIASCPINSQGNGCQESQGKQISCNYEEGICFILENGEVIGECGISDEICYTDFEGTGWVCVKEEDLCRKYEEGKVVSECPINETGDGCEESTVLNGLICAEAENTCHYFIDGKDMGECTMEDRECYEKFGLSGFVCIKDEGLCYTFEDGKIISDCTINENGDGCQGTGPNGGGTGSLLNGMMCDEESQVCYMYEEGELINECSIEDVSCLKSYPYFYMCDSLQSICQIILDGEQVLYCDKNKGFCVDPRSNEVCPINAQGIGCDMSSMTFACNDKWGSCFFSEGNLIVGECPINEQGNGCIGYFMPQEKPVPIGNVQCDPKKDICYFQDNDGNIIGKCRGVNEAQNGCVSGNIS